MNSPVHTEMGLNLDCKCQKIGLFPPLAMATEVSKQVGRELSSCERPFFCLRRYQEGMGQTTPQDLFLGSEPLVHTPITSND